METNSILTANILDILFDGKNKAYGAYDLRNTYDKRINTAMGITALVVMIFVGAVIGKTATYVSSIVGPTIEISPPNPDPKKEIVIPKKTITSVQVKTFQNTTPVILIDKQVPNPSVEVDKLDGRIDVKTNDGPLDNMPGPPVEIKNSGVNIEGPKKLTENDGPPFTKVEVEAKFNGNWSAYLQKEIEKNMDELTEAGESGTCIVRFVVSKDGSVSNVEAVTMKGTKLAEVAVNAIRKGPKWIPAQQNGTVVNAYRQQPITFKIND